MSALKLAPIILLLTAAPCASAQDAPPAYAPAPSGVLDGLSVEGSVRARGMMGFVSVPGELSFVSGALLWTVEGEVDSGPYETRAGADPDADSVWFTAEHVIENGERVVWTGWHDGERFHHVAAEWIRVEGDVVHDLLLPDTVILDFTPND